ncbi:MAG: hypothetical protein Q4D80_00655 [Pseudomonadota bacterium]|nr:hypothetical protein [Pseudomonadota bacterium]
MDETQENKTDNAGLDWNKKGSVPAERLSLRIDAQEANRYQAKEGKAKLSELSPAMKSLRKRVRNRYDEEEDDGTMDEDALRAFFELQLSADDASNNDNSLVSALSPAERGRVEQRNHTETVRQEEYAGKMNALQQSDTLSNRAGISRMSTAEMTMQMQDAIYNPRRLRLESLEKNITEKVGIKGKITQREVGQVVEGIKKINKTTNNRKVNQIKMSDARDVGKKNLSKNATAELILKKSGQTARLTEIKMRNIKAEKDKDAPKPKRSYAAEMKKLLQASLQKNGEVR